MSLKSAAIGVFEHLPLPDAVTAAGIAYLVEQTRRDLARGGHDRDPLFRRTMTGFPIAQHADAANRQHYEIPAEFFGLILGPRRKYSCCLYAGPADTLDAAEETALAETAAHADLHDGQAILELGCGWGSFTLWLAEHYPNAAITAVSNALSQRAFIEGEARRLGLSNLRVLTADMNDFVPPSQYDRVVSVEMFEHMANWHPLLARIRQALTPDGRLFLHVFSSRHAPYRFDSANAEDWVARHFFTGGIMPSHSLIRQFDDLFAVEAEWWWNGVHYQHTARDWLANYDANAAPIATILRRVYGSDWQLWRRRWRLFFLSTAGLFGNAAGEAWGVSHYRLTPVR